MKPLARERVKLFDREAQRYDQHRPTYPATVVDAVLGPQAGGLAVLDVGCGTGIASRAFAARGATVLGVEVAPRMAAIARGHGITVEMAAFEEWDPRGRTFDRVTSAQAWHWLDLPVATAKAASVLRPGGRLCLLWNAGWHPDELAAALTAVYAENLPRDAHTVYRGYAANTAGDARTGLTSELDAIAAEPAFGEATEEWFPWSRTYTRDEWLGMLLSRSDHTALPPEVMDRLVAAIGRAIDDQGGSFVMHFETVLVSATRDA